MNAEAGPAGASRGAVALLPVSAPRLAAPRRWRARTDRWVPGVALNGTGSGDCHLFVNTQWHSWRANRAYTGGLQ
jgi:hypothetical protein